MSAIDLFASGLGAFIIVALVLFPYVLNTSRTPPCPEPVPCPVCETCAPAIPCPVCEACPICESCPRPVPCPTCPPQIACPAPQPAPQCPACPQPEGGAKPFLIVAMVWGEPFQDIDLHVRDPAGNVFYYERHNRGRRHIGSSSAELTFDNINGPGAELFSDDRPSEGEYIVCYHYFRARDGISAVAVQGFAFYNQRVALRGLRLTTGNRWLEAARITVQGTRATIDTGRAGAACPFRLEGPR